MSSFQPHPSTRRTIDRIGIFATLAFGGLYAACSSETVAPTSSSTSTTTTSAMQVTSSTGEGGGQTTGGGQGGQAQGGQGGAGGMGAGGMACMPVNAPMPFFDCGGTGSVGSGTPSTCFRCVEDNVGAKYDSDCTEMGCTCKINDVVACTCQKTPGSSTCDNCCPSPWDAMTQPSGSGGGGGAGGFGSSVAVTTATSTGSN